MVKRFVKFKKNSKTSTVIQMENLECGAAALSIVFQYHGLYIPLEILREECGVSRDGSKASHLLKCARKHGFEAKGYKKEEISDLFNLEAPFIVFWQFNHYIVVEKFDKEWITINDPTHGRKRLSYDQFDESFTGVCLSFKPLPKRFVKQKKKSIFRSVSEVLSSSRSPLYGILAVSIAQIIPVIALPLLATFWFDNVLSSGFSNWLPAILLSMGVFGCAQIVLLGVQRKLLLGLQTKLYIIEQSKAIWNMLQKPYAIFSRRPIYDWIYKSQFPEHITQLIVHNMIAIMAPFVTLSIVSIALIYYSAPLGGLLVTLVGIQMVIAIRMLRKTDAKNHKQIQLENKIIHTFMGAFQGLETIKAMGNQQNVYAYLNSQISEKVNTEHTISQPHIVTGSMANFIYVGTILAAIGISALHVINQSQSLGTIVGFVLLMICLIRPIIEMCHSGMQLSQLPRVIDKWNDSNIEPKKLSNRAKKMPDVSAASVQLNNVTYNHSTFDGPIINQLTLSIESGEQVLIEGASGSGKSTLIKLIGGSLEPWSGDVLIGNQNINQIMGAFLPYLIGNIGQAPFFFKGSILDNISMWNPKIEETEVVAICKEIGLHEEIAKLPNQYDYILERDGSNISGGQRQRLEIARALVYNPKVVIMDESMSACDVINQKKVFDAIKARGITLIYATNGAKPYSQMDRLFKLENGTVMEKDSKQQSVIGSDFFVSINREGVRQ